MTQNRRIFLNIVATYGRSLYALVIGLFTARWAFNALGVVDYGLYGVVAGLTGFIAYFNNILGGAVGRFYAVSVGGQRMDSVAGLMTCRMWFTTAIVIHTVLPSILMLIGYPIGVWAIQNFLTVPPDRVEACVCVWRFVCVTCFLSMASVPFNAMYTAKQYIAELTIYSFFTTTANACFLYYMITHPGFWLTRFALWQCLLGLAPNLIIAIRACCLFQECRFLKKYANCWGNVKTLSKYAFWSAWGGFGAMLRDQGGSVLVNMHFGPKENAGMNIGASISSHTNTLSGSMIGAFSPAIYNAWGAGDFDLARTLAYQTCKIGTLCILVFSIPLAIEVDHVLILWLKTPPDHAAGFCLFVLLMNVIDKLAVGHMIAVAANGKIARYQIFLGTSLVVTLPLAWLLVEFGVGIYSIGWAMVATMLVCALGRVWFARHLVGMSSRYWLRRIFSPIMIVTVFSVAVGNIPKFMMEASFLRVLVTTGLVESVLIPLSWFFVLEQVEREFVVKHVQRLFRR